jgi:hypothetical protein
VLRGWAELNRPVDVSDFRDASSLPSFFFIGAAALRALLVRGSRPATPRCLFTNETRIKPRLNNRDVFASAWTSACAGTTVET